MADYSTDTILALDFGTATTRAALFDVVEGMYRFVACGEAPSSAEPPYRDISEGLHHAVLELQTISGRNILNDSAQIIMPATPDGVGVDAVTVTSSVGPAARALLIGLLPDVSVESVRRLANTTYIAVKDTLSLGDRRKEEKQFDAVLKVDPELILVAGGTDNGSREALLKILDNVALACHLLPSGAPPRLLYVGNPALNDKVSEIFTNVAQVFTAPNVQPELGEEVLGPARVQLAQMMQDLRLNQIGGLLGMANLSGGHLHPTAQAEAQIVRYFNRTLNSPGGVLGVNIGSAATSVSAAFKGELFLNVRADLGVGMNASGLLNETTVEQFTRWLPFEAPPTNVREFILNKSVHPHTIPTEVADLHWEWALAREALRTALRAAQAKWPAKVLGARTDVLPRMDLILGSGATLSRAPRPSLAAMLLLDALQPMTPTTLLLDPHHLMAALGALTTTHPMTVVQALDGALLSLGMVFSVVGAARLGSVVCTAKLVTDSGVTTNTEVKFGSLAVLPLPFGHEGDLTLTPRGGVDVGFGPGRKKKVKVAGGAAGLIIDARGRPIVFPAKADKRQLLVTQWILAMGGMA